MSTKIIKASAVEPDVFETSISQALVELETNSDLKAQLRELYITKAKEIELHNKKVIFIFYYQLFTLNNKFLNRMKIFYSSWELFKFTDTIICLL